MQPATMRTIASVGSWIVGLGTVSTRTSPAPYISVARMLGFLTKLSVSVGYGPSTDCGSFLLPDGNLGGVPLGRRPAREHFQRVLGRCAGLGGIHVDAQSRVAWQLQRFEAQVQVSNDRVVEAFAAGAVVLYVVPGPAGAEFLAAG